MWIYRDDEADLIDTTSWAAFSIMKNGAGKSDHVICLSKVEVVDDDISSSLEFMGATTILGCLTQEEAWRAMGGLAKELGAIDVADILYGSRHRPRCKCEECYTPLWDRLRYHLWQRPKWWIQDKYREYRKGEGE